MASLEDDSEDATWDPCPRRLKDVVENEVLPIVVKVLEGVYTASEGSTFSNGDLIKIDSYITVDKVEARKVRGGCQGESFSVPLDYRGKVALVPDVRGSHVVRVVNDLRPHVTKWVRVLQDASFCHQGNEQTLCEGDVIKVEGFKGHVMSCTRGQVALLVPSSVNGQFQVLADVTEYSVRDVLTQFSLPQVVHFLPAQQQVVSETIVAGVSNMDVFQGDVVLERPMREKIVVGHFKGSGEDRSARFARRSVIILPLGDREVADLEVLLPHYSDESDYQFFQMTHFSQSSGELVLDPNALYMDFSRPGVRFIDYKDFGNEEKPPPRPPRRAVSRPEVPPESGRESPDYLEPYAAYTGALQAPPKQPAPSRPPRHHRRSDPPPQSKPHQGTEYGAYSFTLADLGRPELPQQQGPAKKGAKAIGQKIRKFFHSRSSSTSSAQEVPASPTSPSSPCQPPDSEGSEDSDYDQIEETTQKRPQAVVRPNTHGTQPSSTATTRTTPVAVSPTVPFEKPSPRIINPKVKEDPATDNFQKMGVVHITQRLEECSMSKLAKIVQENKLDGAFLSGLSREVLFKPPFNMSEFDLLRFEQIKDGWRPKI